MHQHQTAADMSNCHEAMKERQSPTRDSNQIKHDPVATNRRLHQESSDVGNGNSSNAYSDTGNADTR